MPDAVFVRPRQARMLQRGPAQIVTLTLREMERITTQLSECKSKSEFVTLRKKIFSDYVHLSYILANTFSMPESLLVRQAVIKQSIKNVEHLIETRGTPQIGVDHVRESIFCIETLRRAYRLVELIYARGNIDPSVKEQDQKLAVQFSSSAIWSQLHLDCLRFIVERQIAIGQEILEEILEGLRLSVMAYSFARQGLELRTVREPYLTDTIQDEEDRQLLDESLIDYQSSLNAEP